MDRLVKANRTVGVGNTLTYVRYISDFPVFPINNFWDDTVTSGFSDPKTYVVQTSTKVVERCVLMTTDPGDLVLDPTCGSGTTATIAEQWGRRWITIDTSRVAMALARARIMGARYPYYLLADSREGQVKGVQSRPCRGLCGFSGASLPGTLLSSPFGKPLRSQVRLMHFGPHPAQMDDPEVDDPLTPLDTPRHPRTLQTLAEHRLARRLRHPAADRQMVP